MFKKDDVPIGYVKTETNDSYDFGYALRKEFWHKGIVTEASKALVELLRRDGIHYIKAKQHENKTPIIGIKRQIAKKNHY